MTKPQLDFTKGGGLVTVVAVDVVTKDVLMVAHMNEASFAKTIETGVATYFSRSRNELWVKGESSGHKQLVQDIRTDCDGDALLIAVEQVGGACHKGFRSCFSWRWHKDRWVCDREQVFDPEKIY